VGGEGTGTGVTHLILMAGRPRAELNLMTMFRGRDFKPVLRWTKSLVRKVPTPKVGWKPAASDTFLYSRHFSMSSESEKTMTFLSVMPSPS